MNPQSKEEVITVRTTESIKDRIGDLAKRVKNNKWKFNYGSAIRQCASKSGLIHQLMSENITLPEIRAELKEVEE